MAVLSLRSEPAKNRLLGCLNTQERDRLLALMQVVELKPRQIIQLSGGPLEMVYFPVTAAIALVCVMADGRSTEVGLVGNEGMVGLPALLGNREQPFETVVQIPGTALRIGPNALSDEAHGSLQLEELLLRYTQVFLNQVTQEAACRGHHSVRQRLAKWLLTICDATQIDQFRVTQEFLGQMLGVGRPRVSLAAAAFQQAGLIHYQRGMVTLTDRGGLETTACECYQIIRDEYDHLLA